MHAGEHRVKALGTYIHTNLHLKTGFQYVI